MQFVTQQASGGRAKAAAQPCWLLGIHSPVINACILALANLTVRYIFYAFGD